MKTDRELLELAANAAGYRIDGPASKYMVQGYTFDSLLLLNEKGGHSVWNPLTDDGDALRLAVKLTLEVDICKTGIAVRTPTGVKVLIDSKEEPNSYAATRRAMVRAAAAIGESII